MIARSRLIAWKLVVAALVGCGGSSSSGGPGASSSSTGSSSSTNDQTLCTSVCQTFTSCGVAITANCVSDCSKAATTYKSCAGTAGTDCNALAMCQFEAVAAINCPGGGGVPAGTATCASTADCQGLCNAAGMPPSCGCACTTALNPSLANYLLINDACATNKCPAECGVGTQVGPSCNTCFNATCASAKATCQSN